MSKLQNVLLYVETDSGTYLQRIMGGKIFFCKSHEILNR